MESRPIIKLIPSPLDNILELTNKIFLVALWALTIYTFLKSPKTIPTHFNVSGRADNYGNKQSLLILPILATIIYSGLTKLNKRPHIFNYVTKITEGNALRQYTIATRMLNFLKLSILVIFSLIVLLTYLTTIGVANGIGFWFLPFVLGLVLIPIVVGLSQSLKKITRPDKYE